jgi:transcriptional regulator with XRE-family HTH domain
LVVVLGLVVGRANQGHIAIQRISRDAAVRQALDRKSDRNAWGSRAAFDVADLTPALQAHGSGKPFERERQFLAKRFDVHGHVFAYHEQTGKRLVRNTHADKTVEVSHNANMAKRDGGPTDYEALRQASGWYAAAWRDYRGLKQQELAEEMGSSRGQISDLETGAKTRFNRDWVEKFSAALQVRPGHLIDVNPFTMWEHATRLDDTVRRLAPEDRDQVLALAERLARTEQAA